jgi:hypothetical protein
MLRVVGPIRAIRRIAAILHDAAGDGSTVSSPVNPSAWAVSSAAWSTTMSQVTTKTSP